MVSGQHQVIQAHSLCFRRPLAGVSLLALAFLVFVLRELGTAPWIPMGSQELEHTVTTVW